MKKKRPLIRIPKSISKLPENIRIYKVTGMKESKKCTGATYVQPVDTSKEACEIYGYDLIKAGNVYEMPLGSGYKNIEGKKLVAVGVGAIGKHFEMFFYMEGDKGIFFFQRFRESKDIAKKLKCIGHVDLP